MFQPRGNVLKGATIIGKNMLPIGSIFFPLKVTPMRIEITLNCEAPKFSYTNVHLLKSSDFLGAYTRFPQALEIMENCQKKSSMHGKVMEFEIT